MRLLTIVRPGVPPPKARPGETVAPFDEVAGWVRSGAAVGMLRRYDESRMLVNRIESAGRPLPLALVLRWMTKGAVRVEDTRGRARAIDDGTLADWITQITREPFEKRDLLRRVEADLADLDHAATHQPAALDLSRSPLYLRTDLSFGVSAGGSVGHTAGVINELGRFAGPPILVTTDDIATVDPRIERHLVTPGEAFWNFRELPSFALNAVFEREALRALHGRTPAFVYQRYTLNNYTGLRLARAARVPFVLEYNGSEVWVGRHWGRTLRYEELATRIEQLNLAAADLVVVVSRVLADQVALAGVDRARIVMNPNGVDPDRYRPDVDCRRVRDQYGLGGRLVIGFIGTFGPWHGAEVLARAFAAIRSDPGLRERARLLMIGDGATMPAVREVLDREGAAGDVVFTGLVPQDRGPEHLAACDILVAPHVPNPDGTPFFGSPTKLFEYMAMGRAIAASNLDQIGEVIEHGRTGWLVAPASVEALADGLRTLAADDGLRARLGAAARARVLEQHTWRAHMERTIDALRKVSGDVR